MKLTVLAQGDDVLHLPGIVDAAESSPSAAKEAAVRIRHYLSKEYVPRPHIQYNAVMLVRILADNPGPTFTRNLDSKFVAAYKDLLKLTPDPSLLQIARETLEALATKEPGDESLAPMRELYAKEKERISRSYSHQVGRVHIGAWRLELNLGRVKVKVLLR